MRRPFVTLAAVALTSLAGSCVGGLACAPHSVVRARTEGFGPATVAPLRGHRHHARARDHVDVQCPIALDDPGLVLADVGATAITACDVAIARAQRVRGGVNVDDPAAVLRDLVDEALLATAAAEEAPTLEPAVMRALADALVRDEAMRALEGHRPTEREVERFVSEHPEMAVRDARVHLRQLVFATEAEARAAIAALRAGTAFEELLPRSIDPLATRDQGDLGLLTAEGATGVLPAVVTAGFALTGPNAVADDPVSGFVPSQGRRRRRSAAPRWHVVQLLERVPEERLDPAEVRRRAHDRILRDRYATARAEARRRLGDTWAPRAREAVSAQGLAAVRVRPP